MPIKQEITFFPNVSKIAMFCQIGDWGPFVPIFKQTFEG